VPRTTRYDERVSVHTPGNLVHGYRIVRTLGRGGLGTTFEATREATGDAVALKRLAVADADAWKQIELFEREAGVLSRLKHAAIPSYIDHFTVEGPDGPALYIAQELVVGRSLGELARASGAPMDEAEARRIADELLGVLVYLGERTPPVIHRDIKPDNVLVRTDGSIALVDFGAARAAAGSAQGGSTTVGTYGYMAPEQLHGEATPATDIYGLACTLLFLLTGRPPTDLPRHKLRIDFDADVRVTDAFARWLHKALEPAPEDRFPSARAARAALRGGVPRAGGARTRPWAVPLLVAVALGAASAGAYAWMRSQHGKASAQSAGCPELDALDPKLATLSVEDLERRFRDSWLLTPSTADRQLESIRSAAGAYVPERRACLTRVSLVSSIVSQEHLRRTTPSLWGLDHTSEELRGLYLSVPLRPPYTKDERLDVLAQIETNFLPSLAADSGADRDFWRREYYGLAVVCDAADDALVTLHASRPAGGDCLHLKPRVLTTRHDPEPPVDVGAAIGIQECDQLIVRWSTCDPPRLGWTLDGMKKQDAWTDAQSKASAQRFCKAQLENFPEEACHYKK